MTAFGAGNLTKPKDDAPLFESAFICDSCKRMNIGIVRTSILPTNVHDTGQVRTYWDRTSPSEWAPAYVSGQDFVDVPPHVGGAASEAHKCKSIGAIRSAVLMSRSVIEAIAKDHGVEKGSLVNKIDELHKHGKIKDFTKDTAHLIRAFGNDMAHGDFSVPLDDEDAEGVLDFMDLMLREVYQDPAKLSALQEKAKARKPAQTP